MKDRASNMKLSNSDMISRSGIDLSCFNIRYRSKQNAELATELQRLKQSAHAKDQELSAVSADINQRQDQQAHLKQSLEDVVYEVSQLRADKNQLLSEI